MKYLFIDIRKSDEVYSKRFGESYEYTNYNIPMNMIRFNVQTIIKHLEYIDEIYIVCETGRRSNFIKNKYFKEYERIKVNENLQFSKLNHGLNKVSINEKEMKIEIVGSNGFNYYNVMRIIQTIMGLIMVLVGIWMLMELKKDKICRKINTIPLIVLILFGSMSLYNGLTSTCGISLILEDYLN